jgi:hypothetical protein
VSELRGNKTGAPWLNTVSERDQVATSDFERELATFTGNGFNDTHETTTPDQWFITQNATSLNGRREGWLDIEVPPPAVMAASTVLGPSTAPRDMTIDRRLARVTGNRPWDNIWDGNPNSIRKQQY